MYKGRKLGLNILLAIVLFVMNGIPTLAQTITGSITGTVTDPSGALVADAKVTATNVLTGVATQTSTNTSGIYSLHFLQIGQYKVSVHSPNFASQTTSVFTL